MQSFASAVLLLAFASCATPTPLRITPAVRTWGTLREALRDGHTQARVDLASVASPTMVGVGAVAGLDGEITIAEGVCHVSQVRDGNVENVRSEGVGATILFAAEVPRWRTIPVTRDVAPAELEAFVAKSAAAAGIDIRQPFPFLFEGDLLQLQVHVLAGECPIRARLRKESMKSPPIERRFARQRGRLVGIYASTGGGVITHHGSATHVHVLVSGDAAFTGHCDRVGVAAGAVLRVPDCRSDR